MSWVLDAQALGKRYGRRWALRDCDLQIPSGHVVGLVGPNGAGKSTLLHLAVGLLAPSEPRLGSERVYARSEVERAQRIRELQALMGFSLAEIGVVLETEDVLDKLRSAYRASARPELQRDLLANAMEANDKLVARLDDTLARIRAFRDERMAKAGRLRARAAELDREIGGGGSPKRR